MNLKDKESTSSGIYSLSIITAGCLWGLIGLFSTNLSLGGCSPVEITFIRNTIAAIGLGVFLFFTKREKLHIHLCDLWMFLGTGILSIVFFNIMYFWTVELLPLSMAAILLYTAPCFVMVMSVLLFHEQLTGKKVLALFLAFIGCGFTTGVIPGIFSGAGLGTIAGFGIFTGICSGFGYALYSIFGNFAVKKYTSDTISFYTFLIAAISLLPFCLRWNLLHTLSGTVMAVNAVGIGLVSTMLPFLFYTNGLRHTDPGKASVMAFVEPMVATLVSIFILHQGFSFSGVIGILLIFVSVIILNI